MNQQTQNTHTVSDDTSSNMEGLTRDDLDALNYVLRTVRGAFPDIPYRQSDFALEDDE